MQILSFYVLSFIQSKQLEQLLPEGQGHSRRFRLGCRGRVSSPTFTIVNEYDGPTPLFHFDMYRLPDADALFDIGWEDYLDRGGVCAVEWSERVDDAMPADTLWVDIARGTDESDRIITITGGE